jgi:hypothetical protein
MLRQRKIEVGDVCQPGVDNAGSYVGLGHHGKAAASRTLEIGKLDDFHRGIDFAHQIALRRTGVGRVRNLNGVCRATLRLRYDVAESGNTDEHYRAKQPIERFWPV